MEEATLSGEVPVEEEAFIAAAAQTAGQATEVAVVVGLVEAEEATARVARPSSARSLKSWLF